MVRGDPVCSFFSTARRTNQEAPPLLSGFFARRLSPPSGAAELAVLKQSSPFFLGRLASSRPDKGGVCSALSLCGLTGPRHLVILRCDAVLPVIPHLMRNPEIPGQGIPAKAIPTRGPSLDPASWCGVTRCVHSSQQREERTKKRRRCYRASSLGGCHRPRGLRNSLCSNSPRPSSSVDWPPPGPIKAGFAPPFPFAASLDPATSSYRAATRYPGISSAAIPAGPFPFAAPHWTPHRGAG